MEFSANNYRLFMHENAMDVAFMAFGLLEEGDRTTMIGHYINLGYTGRPWIVPTEPLIVKIAPLTVDFKSKWRDVTDKVNIPRTKPGIPE